MTTNLQNSLDQFTGTNQWYRHSLNRLLLYTDGVMYFAEQAKAHWLIDAVALGVYGKRGLVPDIVPCRTPFAVVTLKVKGGKASIITDDGNDNLLKRNHVQFTDAPEGDWKFYLEGDGEHVVMLLPGEH